MWDHRQVNRDTYVVRRDGVELVHMSIVGLARPSLAVRVITDALARLHGDRVDGESFVELVRPAERELVSDLAETLQRHVTDPFLMGVLAGVLDDLDTREMDGGVAAQIDGVGIGAGA